MVQSIVTKKSGKRKRSDVSENDCACRTGATSRRAVIQGGVGLGVSLALPEIALAQADPRTTRPRAGDFLVKDGDKSNKPLTPADIVLHAEQTFAWAVEPNEQIVRSGSRLNGIILLRYEASELTPETLARSADGIVAYTQICTHNGCDVTDWIPAERVIQCGCHFTKYDPRDSARITEGPAPRPLPALPLKIVDGKLFVAAAYTDRVGFEQA